MILYDIFGIGETIGNFVRGLFWGMIESLMNMVAGMLDALIKGVLTFGILDSKWVSDAYSAALTIMFLIIPVKIIYELLFALMSDNEQTMDIGKKTGGIILCVMLSVSIPVVVPLANTLTVDMAETLTTDVTTKESQLGSSLLSSVFVGFGGMAENGEHGSKKLVEEYKKKDFDITARNDDDNFVWDFSELMVIIGMVIYLVLLFAINIQIATRIFLIAVLYVLGPICCTSLTKYENPNAFVVWKNTLFGQMAMNFAQIMGLSLLSAMVGSISGIGTDSFTGLPVTMAQLALYFGAFSLIITLPNFIQAMIGGYASGALEAANQIQSGLHMMKAATVGALAGGVAATVGRRNSYTGYREGGIRGAIAGNKRQNGTRTGGIVGNTVGQKDINGNRQGGIRGAVVGDMQTRGGSTIRSGGLRGAFAGTHATSVDKDGSTMTMSSGGVAGAMRGAKTTHIQKDEKTGMEEQTKTYQGGLRGAVMGTTTVHKDTQGQIHKTRTGGLRGVVHSRATGSHESTQSFRTTGTESRRSSQSIGFSNYRRRNQERGNKDSKDSKRRR